MDTTGEQAGQVEGGQVEGTQDHGSHDHGSHAADAPAYLPDQPIELDDSNVGAGAATGVWVTGLMLAVMIMLAAFTL